MMVSTILLVPGCLGNRSFYYALSLKKTRGEREVHFLLNLSFRQLFLLKKITFNLFLKFLNYIIIIMSCWCAKFVFNRSFDYYYDTTTITTSANIASAAGELLVVLVVT
jgi:hypothetical protein